MTFWTYIFQIINFLVFVAILYYLLYRPVQRVMQKRKDDMENDRREAEKLRAEADGVRQEAEKRIKELEDERESILKEARQQADTQRKELLQHAEAQAREKLERFRRIMEQERGDVFDKITGDLRDTIVQVVAAILREDSGGIIDRGLDRLEALLDEMPDDEMQSARKALQETDGPVPVRASSVLTDEQRKRLQKLLGEKVGIEGMTLDVTEAPSLLAGLAVTLGHIQLEAHWRNAIDEALKQQPTG